MIRRTPRSTRTDTLFPYTTLFRSCFADLTIVADDARIGEPGLPIGGGYIAPAWVPQVGAKRAKELAFLPGNHVDGRTAEAWGWANAAVPAAQLIACVEAVAARIAKIPAPVRSEEHTSELQSLMRIPYA